MARLSMDEEQREARLREIEQEIELESCVAAGPGLTEQAVIEPVTKGGGLALVGKILLGAVGAYIGLRLIFWALHVLVPLLTSLAILGAIGYGAWWLWQQSKKGSKNSD